MEGLRASTADGGPGHRPSMHPYHPLGSRGAAKLLRPAPAQRISVDLMLQSPMPRDGLQQGPSAGIIFGIPVGR